MTASPTCEESVVTALGWHGTPVDGVRVRDTDLTVVVSDGRDGQSGLAGVLVPVSGSWRQALSLARACLAFAPVALVLTEAPSELCLLECGYADVGIVVADHVVAPARSRRPLRSTRSTFDRVLFGELDRVLTAP
ncbi:hypothetical protein [Cryptosporangium sp. NPDC048952]|uniref:hypothetical protein n=1 Tax=Cryptosporangium sp. NPDC048952 TaxID=3363961 RepID=UPI003711B0E8